MSYKIFFQTRTQRAAAPAARTIPAPTSANGKFETAAMARTRAARIVTLVAGLADLFAVVVTILTGVAEGLSRQGRLKAQHAGAHNLLPKAMVVRIDQQVPPTP